MTNPTVEDELRKQIAQKEADHAAEVVRITSERDAIAAERNKLAKEHTDLNDAFLRLAKRQDFILQQASKLEKTVTSASLDRKSRNIVHRIFHKFNIKVRSAKEEAKEVSKRLHIKSKELQEQKAQLNTEEMTLDLRTMNVEDASEDETCEEEEDVKMALA